MEDRETTYISSRHNYFQLCQAKFCIGTLSTLTSDNLSALRWIYLPRITAKDDLCFLERCSLLSWTLLTLPSLLGALHFGIWSLQYLHCLSVGCRYGTWRYIDKDNLPCRLAKLSRDRQLCKILLDRHTRIVQLLLQSNIPHAEATNVTFVL